MNESPAPTVSITWIAGAVTSTRASALMPIAPSPPRVITTHRVRSTLSNSAAISSADIPGRRNSQSSSLSFTRSDSAASSRTAAHVDTGSGVIVGRAFGSSVTVTGWSAIAFRNAWIAFAPGSSTWRPSRMKSGAWPSS